MRVYEIAQRSGVSNQDIIATLKNLGFQVKNHQSVVDDQMNAALEKEFKEFKPENKEPSHPKEKLVAKFISPHRSLLLVREPIDEVQTRGGFRADLKSGVSYQFTDGMFETNDLDVIEWMINPNDDPDGCQGFKKNFFPLPEEGSYWTKSGLYKMETRQFLTPTEEIEKLKGKAKENVKEDIRQVESEGPEIMTRRTTSTVEGSPHA